MNGTDQTLSEIRQSLLEQNQTATPALPQERSEFNRTKAQSPAFKSYLPPGWISLASLMAQSLGCPIKKHGAKLQLSEGLMNPINRYPNFNKHIWRQS
jgi:hypothetical protein